MTEQAEADVEAHGSPEVAAIYALARRWATEVLPAGGSLLTPGSAIWTAEALSELEEKFLDRPDMTPGKTFLKKLQDQLHDASPAAIQLMAEVHVIAFLWVWTGAISASKKLADINAILSWHPDRPIVPEEIAGAMSPGIVHPGQWAMTRRDTQLGALIKVAGQFVRTTADRQQALLADPFAFRDFVMGVPTQSGDNAKLGLLHVIFPDVFEPTVAPQQKEWIAARFADYAGDDSDLDRRLLSIREHLSREYGPGFSYYDEQTDPLVNLWWKSRRWTPFLRWLEEVWLAFDHAERERDYKLVIAQALRTSRDALLSGDPEWPALLRTALAQRINNLMAWQDRDTLMRWVSDSADEAEQALRALWEPTSGESPSSRLDSFADTLKTAGITHVGAALNLGSMLLMAEDETTFPPLKIRTLRKLWKLSGWSPDPPGSTVGRVHRRTMMFLDEVLRQTSDWSRPMRDRLDAQGALWTLATLDEKPSTWTEEHWTKFREFQDGALPGNDDEPPNDAPSEPPHDLTAVDQIKAAADDLYVDRVFLDQITTLLDDKGQVVLYGPPGTGKTYLARRLARALADDDPDRYRVVQFHPATNYEDFFEGLRPRLVEGQVHYELQAGPLAAMADLARKDEHRRYVMVIDELNRANIPKVFGELLYLLEYREDRIATLYRPTELFALPSNLYLIATMNTADRSVALVDTALRRRFHFIPFFPHQGQMQGLLRRWLQGHSRDAAVADLLDAVNQELRTDVGDHLLIGPSHFMKEDLSEEALERIWDFNIYPTLEELLWGRTDILTKWRWPAVRRRFAALLKLPDQPDEHDVPDDEYQLPRPDPARPGDPQ